MEQATIFVVDDDVAVTDALRGVGDLLNMPVEVHHSAESFLQDYNPARPGCLVLDYQLPGKNGLSLQQDLVERGSLLPIILISGEATIRIAVKATQQGVVNVLEKPFALRTLCDEIQRCLDLDNERREKSEAKQRANEKIAHLTAKEREVFDLVVSGHTNKEMSHQLGLSMRAIEDRRARMLKKLGCEFLSDLIQLARESELR